IVSGSVDMTVNGAGKVAERGKGDVIGEMAALANITRRVNCIAATEVQALKIAREPFLEALGEKSELALGIIRVLIQRIEEIG
ncbi:MAG: cyclic nucleotide-binding domain-containing protein, partial [Planctomycetota bacterium]